MNKNDIKDFFDRHADMWDSNLIRHDDVICEILDNACVYQETSVLDVACGTGVLFPDYSSRHTAKVMAVDLSPRMAYIAAEKAENYENIEVLCADIEELELPDKYDCCIVYNAFPHFPDPEKLVSVLSEKIKPNGTLSIAHGMSRDMIDRHHKSITGKYAISLISEYELAEIMSKYLHVYCLKSDERMYQVCGRKTSD